MLTALPLLFVAAVVLQAYAKEGDAREAARDGWFACIVAMLLMGALEVAVHLGWLGEGW